MLDSGIAQGDKRDNSVYTGTCGKFYRCWCIDMYVEVYIVYTVYIYDYAQLKAILAVINIWHAEFISGNIKIGLQFL